ncbi:hypothetical protein [Brevundimonas sp.]|uniref:hypothetical protein n=1 Tax=Brevundimonas sp. TaxID=1871086 RepID=UPI003564CDFE
MAVGGSIWKTLGISPTNEVDDIRRAYARRLKQVHPEDDPEGFQTLRAAYEQASNMARRGWAAPVVGPSESSDDGYGDDEYGDDAYDDDDAFMEHGGHVWSARPENRRDDRAAGSGDRSPRPEGHWQRPEEPEMADDIRQELAGEQARGQAHAALCDALMEQVQSPTATFDDRMSALMAVFRSPAMAALDVHGRTEHWLAHLIAGGPPAVEVLIEPAVQFFGWSDARVGVDLSHAQPVMMRLRAIHAARQIVRPGSPGHAAFETLRAKQTPLRRLGDLFKPGLDREVRRLLERIDYEIPALATQLAPPAVERWRKRLGRPGLTNLVRLLLLVIAPPVLGGFTVLSNEFGVPNWPLFGAAWVLWTCIAGLLALAWVWGIGWPSRRWIEGYPWDQPLWKRMGWAPAALLLPPVSLILPSHSVAALGLLVTGIGLAAWARITVSHMARPGETINIWSLGGLSPVLALCAFQLDARWPGAGMLLIGAFAGGLPLALGVKAFPDEWSQMSDKRRRGVSLGLGAAAVAATAAMATAPLSGLFLPAVAVVCVVALADRALSWGREDGALYWRRLWVAFGWIAVFAMFWIVPTGRFEDQMTVTLGLWLMSAAVMTAVSPFLPTPRARQPKTKKKAGQFA